MDWEYAIERNRAALQRILAALVSMAGLGAAFTSPLWGGRPSPDGRVGAPDGSVEPPLPDTSQESPQGGEPKTLPRYLHRAVLRLLRPAEAAARRLIVIAARGIVAPLPPPPRPRPAPEATPTILRDGKGTGIVMPRGWRASPPRRPAKPAFSLFDPLPRRTGRPRNVQQAMPRICFPGFVQPAPVPPPPTPRDLVGAARLVARLKALASVLDDLPGQARRFARWRAARDAAHMRRDPKPRRVWPLRPGHPPGWREKPDHDVHAVLGDTNWLARWVLQGIDTS